MRITFLRKLATWAGAGIFSVAIATAPVWGQAGGSGGSGSGGSGAGAGGSGSGAGSGGSASGSTSSPGASGSAASRGGTKGASGRGSGSAAARTGGSPGRSSSAASRTGTAPGSANTAGPAGTTRSGSTGNSGTTRAGGTGSSRSTSPSANGSTRTASGTSGTGSTTRDATRSTTRDARDAASDARDAAADTVRETREAGDRFDQTRSTSDRNTTSGSTSRSRSGSSGFSDPNRDVRDVLRDNIEAREREFGSDPYEGRRGPGVGDAEGPIGNPGVSGTADSSDGDRFDAARSASGTTTRRSASGTSRSTSDSSGFSDPNRDVRDVLRENAEIREREFGEDPYEGRLGPGVGDEEGPLGNPGVGNALRDAREDLRDTRDDAREDFRDARESGTTSTRDAARDFQDRFREGREEFRDTRDELRDDLRDTRDDVRDARIDARTEAGADSRTRLTARDLGLTFRNSTTGRLTIDNLSATSPLSEYGFQAGDQILSVNGTRLANQNQLFDALVDPDFAGEDLQVAVWRDGEQEVLTVDPQVFTSMRAGVSSQSRLTARDLGLSFNSTSGRLTIDNLAATSPLTQFGFQVGDQILSVNGSRLANENQLFAALADPDLAGQEIQVAVWRDGEQELLTVDPQVLLSADADALTRGRIRLTADDVGLQFSTDRGRVVIDEVEQSGLMSEFGFESGDQLLSVNGVRIANDRQFLQFLTNPAFARGDLQVAVWRDGQQEILTVDPQAFVTSQAAGRISADFDVNSIRSADIGLWLRANSTGRGLVVSDIGTGAISRFGFQEGDQILSVNGIRIADQRHFLRAMFDPDFANQPVEVAVWRNGEQEVVSVQPSLLIEDFRTSAAAQVDPLESWGMVLDDRYDDYPVLWRVSPRSPAFYAGLRPGDVVVNWAGQRISSPSQLSTLIQQAEAGQDVAIQVSRNGRLRSITLDADELRTSMRPSIEGAGGIDTRFGGRAGELNGVGDPLDRGFDRATDRSFDPTNSLPRTGTGRGTDRSFDPTGSLPRPATNPTPSPIRSTPSVGVDGAGVDVDATPGAIPRPFGR